MREKVKLFLVPLNHRGSTEHILKEAVKNLEWPDYSGIIYIAPTPRKIRDAQKIFHNLVKSPYIPPQFFTFNQLSKYFFDTEAHGRYLPQALVPLLLSEISGRSIGYSCMLSELLKELKQHHPLKGISLIRLELSEIFSHKGIPEDISKNLNLVFDIFEKYQNTIACSNYFDDDDILNSSSSAAPRIIRNCPVFVADGFYDMTTSEKNLFAALAENAGTTLLSIPAPNNLPSDALIDFIKMKFTVTEEHLKPNSKDALPYTKYNDIEEEIEGTARLIKNSYICGRLNAADFIILTFPCITDYADLTERVLKKYGLPYSIFAQKPPSQKSALRNVLYLIEAAADDFPRLIFTSVLNSKCFRHIPETLKRHMPSISLRAGIIKGKESWINLSSSIDDRILAKTIKQELLSVFRTLERLIRLRDSAGPDALGSEIKKVLSELGFEAEQNDIDKLSNSMEMINTIAGLSGRLQISLSRYAEFLRHLLSLTEYRHEDEGIQIMDFMEIRGLEPDYLYFCGLKDSDFPSKPAIDHILPDSVKTEYGLVNLNKYLAIQKLNFLRITGASLNIHLSYPAMDGDRLFLPSSYLPWSEGISEKILGIFSTEELQVKQGDKPLSDSIREIQLDKKTLADLLEKELSMPMRVTDIDYFRKCPRRFFIEKVLNLKASEIAEYEVEAKLLGTIAHRIMEELIKEPLDDEQRFKEKASLIIDRTIKDYSIEGYWKKLIKESFMEVLPEIIEVESELRHDGFMPYEIEKKIEEELLPGISLKGKIDRIDRSDNAYRILDYKTGTVNIGAEIIKKGKELQLPLYAAMLKSRGMNLEKAGIYSLKDIDIKWIPTKRDKYTLDEYISSTLKFLKETILEINRGNFNAIPVDEFLCSSCLEAPFCPYIHSKGEIQHA